MMIVRDSEMDSCRYGRYTDAVAILAIDCAQMTMIWDP